MSRSEGELICFQLIAKRQLSGSFPSFQILNLQTRVRFPVALPTLFQSFTHFLTWSLQATVASFCTASTGAPYNWLRRWRAQYRTTDSGMPANFSSATASYLTKRPSFYIIGTVSRGTPIAKRVNAHAQPS